MITSERLTRDMAVGGVACEIIPRGIISLPSFILSDSCQRSVSRGVKYMMLLKANLLYGLHKSIMDDAKVSVRP